MAEKKLNTREIVLEMLIEIVERKEYSHLVIRNVLDKYNYLKVEEKAFMKRLCEGTQERMIQIDYIINQYSKIKVNKMKPVIRNIIRMGTYQIMFMQAVPDSAACNESVKLTEIKKFYQLKGFVNGVLRTIARQKDSIVYPDKKTNFKEYLSIRYSIPEWMVEKWMTQYDSKLIEKMLEALLQEHGITIRFDENLSIEERETIIERCSETGIQMIQHPYLNYAYKIENMEGVKNLPGFQEGFVTIQDISSMFVSEVAGIKKGAHIIDVCAAPGGKSLHAACKLNGTGIVEARDLTELKTALIQQNIERMNYTNIRAEKINALEYQKESKASADILFADLPCSGLGVIGKKRDIKYKITMEGICEIVKLQKEILKTVQNYVKAGGILIYSTCTINREENEEMIEWFINQFPFVLESLDSYLPEELHNDTTKKGYLQFLPGVHDTDGFFVAKLRKQEVDA